MRQPPSILPMVLTQFFRMVIDYIAANFLVLALVIISGGLIFDYLMIFGNNTPVFLQDIVIFLQDKFGSSGNKPLNLNTEDILRIYNSFVFWFFLLSMAVRGILSLVGRLFGGKDRNPKENNKTAHSFKKVFWRFIVFMIPVTLIFLTAFIAMPFSHDFMAKGQSLAGFYVCMGGLYVITLVLSGVYALLEGVSDFVTQWAESYFSNQNENSRQPLAEDQKLKPHD